MHPPIWTTRSIIACAAGAVGLGVAVTAAGIGVSIARAGRGTISVFMTIIAGRDGGNFACTVSEDRWASGVTVQVFPPVGPGGLSEADLARGVEAQREILAKEWSERPGRALYGGGAFSSVPSSTAMGAVRWSETTLGWPVRCLRVRGRDLRNGPVTFGQVWNSGPLAGRWGLVLAPWPTMLSVGAVAGPAMLGLFGGCGWWLHRRRRERAARGLCVRCGYESRARTCPECGWAAASTDPDLRRSASGPASGNG